MSVASALASIRRWLAPPEPEPVKPNVAAKIDREMDLDALRALIAGMAPSGTLPQVNPFTPNFNPPTVVKEALSAKGLAYDSVPAAGVVDFARQGLAGIIGPREGFLGFPELAILSLCVPSTGRRPRLSRLNQRGNGLKSRLLTTLINLQRSQRSRRSSSASMSKVFFARYPNTTRFSVARICLSTLTILSMGTSSSFRSEAAPTNCRN
jgi:hypothetical protein